MKKRGSLFVVSGPSGVGKGTIINELFRTTDDLFYSISVTSRLPREGEKEGVNYFFVTQDEFKLMIEADEFLEWAHVYSNYYGTPRKFVEEQLELGKDVILEIDIQGSLQVKRKFSEGIFIFILPPSLEELEDRIRGRGTEREEQIQERFQQAAAEIVYKSYYNYHIINDQLETAVNKLKAVVLAERCRNNEVKEIE